MGLFGRAIGNDMEKIIDFLEILMPLWIRAVYVCIAITLLHWLITGTLNLHCATRYFTCISIGTTAHAVYEWYQQ